MSKRGIYLEYFLQDMAWFVLIVGYDIQFMQCTKYIYDTNE